MAPSKIKKALGAVKDQTTIGLAKVGSSTSLADLEVAIVKATKHNEHPADEKYIREILSLTCYSRTYISACVTTKRPKNPRITFASRLNMGSLLACGSLYAAALTRTRRRR